MTSPAPDQDLLTLLGLVDASRARSTASEAAYRSEVVRLYAARLAEVESSESEDELLNEAVLVALVLVIRKAFSSGVSEGAVFAIEQLGVVGVSANDLGNLDLSSTEIPDKLVRDFLAGQIVVVKSGKARRETFAELARRADLAVVSAFQAGRGWATELALDALAAKLSGSLHKLWVARFDLVSPPCPMCVRLHGRHVPVGQAFSVPDSEAKPYFSPLQAPPRHPNCRCSLVLFLPDKMSPDADVTPLSMQAYADWQLKPKPAAVALGESWFTPEVVSDALDVLLGLSARETGVVKPLKAAESPLTSLDLPGLVHESKLADPYRGSSGSVHYSKMKPALIAVLQDALGSPG